MRRPPRPDAAAAGRRDRDRRRHQVLSPDHRQGLRGGGGHREHGVADGRRRAGDEVERRSRSTPPSSGAARCRPTARPRTSAPAIRDASTRSTRRRRAARRAWSTTLEAAWVTALAVRPDGTLIAGTTPGGRVYTIDPKRRQGEAVRDADRRARLGAGARRQERHRLRRDWAGRGRSPRSTRAARARAIWDSGDKHVVSLIAADDKHLYAGTSEEAILFKVGLDGHAEALADFDAEEVRALARYGGTLYAAVNDFERGGGAAPLTPGAAAAPRGTKITDRDVGVAGLGGIAAAARASARPRPRSTASTPTGAWSRCSRSPTATSRRWRSTTAGAPTSAPAARAASAASPPTAPPRWRSTCSERQALTLLRAGNGFLVGTGDVGGVYRAAPAAPRQATYLSRVLDGEYRSRWGLFRWHGSHDVAIESRSGNTAKPDATWTGFTALEKPRPTARGRRRPGRQPARALRPVPRDLRRARGTAGGGDARLPAAEPARAHHRARPGGRRRRRRTRPSAGWAR